MENLNTIKKTTLLYNGLELLEKETHILIDDMSYLSMESDKYRKMEIILESLGKEKEEYEEIYNILCRRKRKRYI